ncbi:MAG: IS110 family transposase [Bacillota bacterium]
MAKSSTIAAGIDVAKAKLDIAIDGCKQRWEVSNDLDGFHQLAKLLRSRKVNRIGLEATGGYERDVTAYLRKAGFIVLLLQPRQVRAFAEAMLRWAKNDRIDAGTIAAFTTLLDVTREAPDPRYAPLADSIVFIEQIEEDLKRIKTRLEHVRLAEHRRIMLNDLKRLKLRRARMLAKLEAAVRSHADIAERLDLVLSIDGLALRTSLALVILMPELGKLSREQAAALAGVAPFDDRSGKRDGERHIWGGRARLRSSVYAAALPASFQWNSQLIALYQRLVAAGKDHKVALIACTRKLIIFANAVLARGTPWTKSAAPT